MQKAPASPAPAAARTLAPPTYPPLQRVLLLTGEGLLLSGSLRMRTAGRLLQQCRLHGGPSLPSNQQALQDLLLPSGTTLCGGTCIDTSTDFNNCGACGNQCPQFAQCISGNCKCPPGFNAVCPIHGEKFCANTNTDPDFCGSCNKSCLQGQQVCCNGSCRDLDTTFCGTSCADAAPCRTPRGWTAPSWQGKILRRSVGRCSHVFGL